MSREYITGEREKQRSYSRAVKVKGGTTVYLAGVGGGVGAGEWFPRLRKSDAKCLRSSPAEPR